MTRLPNRHLQFTKIYCNYKDVESRHSRNQVGNKRYVHTCTDVG